MSAEGHSCNPDALLAICRDKRFVAGRSAAVRRSSVGRPRVHGRRSRDGGVVCFARGIAPDVALLNFIAYVLAVPPSSQADIAVRY